MYLKSTSLTLLSNTVAFCVTILLWSALLKGNEDKVFLIQSLLVSNIINLVVNGGFEYNIASAYLDGSIVYQHLRSVSFFAQGFCIQIARVLLRFLISSAGILLICFSLQIWPQFNLTVLLSCLISFYLFYLLDCLVGFCVVKTTQVFGVSLIKSALASILGGVVIPFSFMPQFFKIIGTVFPFKAIYQNPYLIFSSGEPWKLLTEQLIWAGVLTSIYFSFYPRVLKSLNEMGG